MVPVSAELTLELLAFRKDRDWEQFHTPRNLAASVAIEAEPPRDSWRLQLLREWSHDQDQTVFP